MKRFGQIIKLKEEGIKKYIEYHANPWPLVNAKLKEAHIERYSIFRRDNILFAYFEYTGTDYQKDMELIAADPTTRRWWALVKPLMEPIESRVEGEFWAHMEEIFHLD